jgi:hypothetical protein
MVEFIEYATLGHVDRTTVMIIQPTISTAPMVSTVIRP